MLYTIIIIILSIAADQLTKYLAVATGENGEEYLVRFRLMKNKEGAIASRKSVINRAKQEGWTLFGMHFPTKDGVKVK